MLNQSLGGHEEDELPFGELVRDCTRKLHLPAEDAILHQIATAVDGTLAALESLAATLNRYVHNQLVVNRADLERYGVRARIDPGVFSAAGGPALRTSSEALNKALLDLRAALSSLVDTLTSADTDEQSANPLSRSKRRITRLARSLLRDLRTLLEHYQWFWQFTSSANYVRMIELSKVETSSPEAGNALRSPIVISARPINVGPPLWEHFWSRLHSAVCTSATLTVYGQGFDFFLRRVGLEAERIAVEAPGSSLVTRELPPAFDYPNRALLMPPNDLPAPRDSDLKRAFPAAVAELLQRFIPFFSGKTLGLFTSNARRDFVYERLVDHLAAQGWPLFRQGSLSRVLDDFRTEVKSSLLGSRSLWEGVDIAGESLSYVLLEKLPYPSLGDPIEAALMNAVENASGNPFYDYLLPKIILVQLAGLKEQDATLARVLLFTFEEAGLVQRGPDCTLEATILLNQPPERVLAALENEQERTLLTALFNELQAVQDRQVTYRALDIYRATGIDPRLIDPLLVRLGERELLLYRAYSRGITLLVRPAIGRQEHLQAI